ncbi:MAG: hypothetical protein ACOY30_10610 [Bacillota bacterium]
MQLDPGERSVLAYFPSGSGARKAAQELSDMGYQTVHVDRISHYGEGGEVSAGAAPARMTLYSSNAGPGDNISLGTVSGDGLWAGGHGGAGSGADGGRAFLVTVLTSEGNSDQVTGILEKHGGRI